MNSTAIQTAKQPWLSECLSRQDQLNDQLSSQLNRIDNAIARMNGASSCGVPANASPTITLCQLEVLGIQFNAMENLVGWAERLAQGLESIA